MLSRANALSVLVLVAAGACGLSCRASGDADDGATASGDGSAEPGDGEGGAGADASPEARPVDHMAITDVAYFPTDQGPRVFVRGIRPRYSPLSLRVELLDAAGQPAVLEPDSSGITQPSELDIEIEAADSESFFYAVESTKGVDQRVRSVAVTARDASSRAGERFVVALAPRAVRGPGEACDAQGFDTCAPDHVCAPGDPTMSNRCENAAATREKRCADAPELLVGGPSVTGAARAASLWDPPDGCASAERRSRPDAALRLHVAAFTPSLSLSTAGAGTDFDTVVYVLEGCPSTSALALACNDDEVPPTSKVTLKNVAPGDYLVIVDALTREGGAFSIRATAP